MGSMQRGAMVARNDNGTLEKPDSKNVYIGSATLENGKVITKRFRGVPKDEQKIIESWEKWQCRKVEEEDDMAEITKVEANATSKDSKAKTCPFSGNDCGAKCPMWSVANGSCSIMLGGIGLFNIAANLMKLDVGEELELIALAVAESRKPAVEHKEPVRALTEQDGVDLFLDGKKFLDFVNLSSKRVFSDYKKALNDTGYPLMKEAELVNEVVKRFPELKKKGVHGGSVLVAA